MKYNFQSNVLYQIKLILTVYSEKGSPRESNKIIYHLAFTIWQIDNYIFQQWNVKVKAKKLRYSHNMLDFKVSMVWESRSQFAGIIWSVMWPLLNKMWRS